MLSTDAPARLFCFLYVGAGASSLRLWPDRQIALDCAIERDLAVRLEPGPTFEHSVVADLAAYADRFAVRVSGA
ncbi:hypothetical protein [Streptomyces sp. NPDC059743]|uniref:hypothetical protein n=1 Tax=Streptomyces sp. NPDC059743 TaxID=3346928 RepID=UPI0036561B84